MMRFWQMSDLVWLENDARERELPALRPSGQPWFRFSADLCDGIRAIADKLESPHADKVFVAKGYTKADLIADLRKLIAGRHD